METLNTAPNFVIFLIESTTHCYTYKSNYYTANTLSDTGFSSNASSLGLAQWVSSLPLHYDDSISTRCSGASPDCAASYADKIFTLTTPLPSSAPSDRPTPAPSAVPTALGTVVLSNDLSCLEECAVSADVVGGSDTCLFVTLMDQFGDGWLDGTRFSYWLEVRGEEASNVVSMALDCGCPRMSGCIRPSELSADQVLRMTAVSVDESSGEVRVPAYFWEVYWTVQVVEGGVWKDKYYGGYNTSLSFAYSPSLQAFEAAGLSNVWKPEADMSCASSPEVSDWQTFLAARVYAAEEGSSSTKPYSFANETSSYVVGGGGGYHESVWVITDTAVSVTTVTAFNALFALINIVFSR
jgi:hypothetical protein